MRHNVKHVEQVTEQALGRKLGSVSPTSRAITPFLETRRQELEGEYQPVGRRTPNDIPLNGTSGSVHRPRPCGGTVSSGSRSSRHRQILAACETIASQTRTAPRSVETKAVKAARPAEPTQASDTENDEEHEQLVEAATAEGVDEAEELADARAVRRVQVHAVKNFDDAKKYGRQAALSFFLLEGMRREPDPIEPGHVSTGRAYVLSYPFVRLADMRLSPPGMTLFARVHSKSFPWLCAWLVVAQRQAAASLQCATKRLHAQCFFCLGLTSLWS